MDAGDLLSDLKLFGGKGHDDLFGGKGSDELDGGLGNDALIGGLGNDTLTGGLGNDILNGGKGIDTIVFGDLDTKVSLNMEHYNKAQDTGHGLDTINTLNIENITTGSGNDVLTGQWVDNVLDGGSGNDKLYGDRGNDTLIGGLGNDILNGGGGADTFQFNINDGQDLSLIHI